MCVCVCVCVSVAMANSPAWITSLFLSSVYASRISWNVGKKDGGGRSGEESSGW